MEIKGLETKVIIACRTVLQTPQPNFQVLGHVCARCEVALQISNSAIEVMREHEEEEVILLCTTCALMIAKVKEKQNLLAGVSYTKDAVREPNGDVSNLIERFNSKVC